MNNLDLDSNTPSKLSYYGCLIQMNLNCSSAMVLLDLQKIFDSVWHDLLYYTNYMYLPEYLTKIIKCFKNLLSEF